MSSDKEWLVESKSLKVIDYRSTDLVDRAARLTIPFEEALCIFYNNLGVIMLLPQYFLLLKNLVKYFYKFSF